jgi:hypothetical protein
MTSESTAGASSCLFSVVLYKTTFGNKVPRKQTTQIIMKKELVKYLI